MGVCVRVDGKAVADVAQGFERGEIQRVGTAAPRSRGPGGKAAARAPGIDAVIPETGILTDPTCLLTRERANAPYLTGARGMPQRSIDGARIT
ncbi:hypothetical protein C0Z16_09370 [Paraburkholderia rhynchosiae]|uniref:Uncharacterized protein n=1 Tax=Paraburkholderia rhynchosiae TaxID=487049 RepID=A0ABX4V8C9_9BURK|nr:hypothetical protein C0Z16_09370 [Paraburkholderia rhynchosiae]